MTQTGSAPVAEAAPDRDSWASPDERRLMGAAEAAHLAARYGIPHPAQAIAASPGEAVELAEVVGYPVALKSLGATVVHKSDVGGVRLGLDNRDAVGHAALALIEGVPGTTELLVQNMAEAGIIEMIVGAKHDPVFGPVVMVGLGGLWAEIFEDVAIRLAPVSPQDAREMIDSLRVSEVLRGARGKPSIDEAGVVSVITAVSRLIDEHPRVHEIDLNPVICDADRVEAVDIRIIEGPPRPTPRRAVDRTAAVQALLRPQRIAVFGASRDPGKQGSRLLRNILRHGYTDTVDVVHPTASEIQGYPAAPTVGAVDGTPDLACIAVPSHATLETLESCGRAGVRAAILFGSGFAETGDGEDLRRQNEIMDVADRYGMAVCGPNTAGVASSSARLCATMSTAFDVGDGELPIGTTALVTQSGAIGGSLLSRLRETGLGFSHWVATGNESDLTLSDYVAWLADDPDTQTVLLFVEAIRDAATFRASCLKARANGKRIIAYKTGASAAGQAAVRSHTAALAGDDAVYREVFRALDVIQVDDLQSLIDAAVVLDWQPLPRGSRIGVVSGSGGACSVVADGCERAGLVIPAFAPATRQRVAAAIPSFGNAENPVDVTMQINVNPVMVGEVTQAMLEDDGINAILVMMTSNADPPALQVAHGVIAAARSSHKPVVVARMGAEELAPRSLAAYRNAEIPVFPMPDRAIAALAVACRIGDRTQPSTG